MKVLVISDYNAPYAGNFIEAIKSLNKYANENGDGLFYLFPNRTSDKKYIEELSNLSKNKVNHFTNDSLVNVYSSLKNICRKENIDIIYCHFCRPKTQIAIKLFCIFHKKVKLVSHFHNHCKDSKNILKKLFYKMAYQFYKGNLNIGCSESVMMSMPYKSKYKTYVDNAIDFSRLDEYKKVDISNGRNKVVLMFGFDYYRKGIDIAIKAIRELNKNITLAISLASNRDKVEKYIIDEFNEIPDFINFLTPINDVASYYKNSDIFLSAAREEGFCYSLVEAAYCGTKIISSNIGGVPKNIPGEKLFESGNYKDLIHVLGTTLNEDVDPNAKEYVLNNYGIEHWTKDIYNSLKKVNDEF